MKCKPKDIGTMWTTIGSASSVTLRLHPNQIWDYTITKYHVEVKRDNVVLTMSDAMFEKHFRRCDDA